MGAPAPPAFGQAGGGEGAPNPNFGAPGVLSSLASLRGSGGGGAAPPVFGGQPPAAVPSFGQAAGFGQAGATGGVCCNYSYGEESIL
jgi:hypothetical protein